MSKAQTIEQISDVTGRANIETAPAKAADEIVQLVRKEALSGTTVKKAGRKIKSLTGVEVTTAETRELLETMFACVFEDTP